MSQHNLDIEWRIVKAFELKTHNENPNQPRANDGKWTSGNGGSSQPKPLEMTRRKLKPQPQNSSVPKIKSSEVKLNDKITKQMQDRGWNEKSLRDTIDNPHVMRDSLNKVNGNPATAYYNKNGDYVTVDRITKDVIQVSKYGDRNWMPDSEIINPWRP